MTPESVSFTPTTGPEQFGPEQFGPEQLQPATARQASVRVLYVLPAHYGHSAVVQSIWLQSSNLARALGRALGGVDILTPSGLATFDDLQTGAVVDESEPSAARSLSRHLPAQLGLLAGEARSWLRARRFRRMGLRFTAGCRYGLVVQLHARHQTAGEVVARRMGVPFVLRVEALEISEEAAWGLRRPLWGNIVERFGELRVIRRADLVAAISAVLDRSLDAAGVPSNRRVVVPSGVDLARFSPGPADADLRRQHGLEGRFVLGWVGGFRPMHGLEDLPEIARALRERFPDVVVCLVGTGPLKEQVARDTATFSDTVRLVGPAAHADVPKWIRSFDACLLLASPGEFHYSPLKLYEYMACGKPVIAARAGEVADVVVHEQNGLLVPRGDPKAVVAEVARLVEDEGLRTRLEREARSTAERSASWDARASDILRALRLDGVPYGSRASQAQA